MWKRPWATGKHQHCRDETFLAVEWLSTPELHGSVGIWRGGAAGRRRALDMLEPKNWVGKRDATRVSLGVCERRGPAEAPALFTPVPEPCPSPLLRPPPPNLLLNLPALLQAPQPPSPCPLVPQPCPLQSPCPRDAVWTPRAQSCPGWDPPDPDTETWGPPSLFP